MKKLISLLMFLVCFSFARDPYDISTCYGQQVAIDGVSYYTASNTLTTGNGSTISDSGNWEYLLSLTNQCSNNEVLECQHYLYVSDGITTTLEMVDGVCTTVYGRIHNVYDRLNARYVALCSADEFESSIPACIKCPQGTYKDANHICVPQPELKDGNEGTCKASVGSYVIPKTRELHEDIDIQGSDITLHYS
ncbi:MAG: hypothetical protein LBL65_00690, partial [Campylobacteraceae bacterium]|nr:hypothetical protein [Campylobacteraceae bacterium]